MILHFKNSTLCFITVLLAYMLSSLLIFNKVYRTTKEVVDEEFHLPMGRAYCQCTFSLWDSKVTTLPGLYVISTFLLAPFGACSTYWLRFVSLIAAVVNMPLLYILLSTNKRNKWSHILSSLTLVLVPPIYFFSHFYYTDIVSLSAVLGMFVLNAYGLHYLASFVGLIAVVCRQTNIMWVYFLLGKYVFVEMFLIFTDTYHLRGPRGIPLRRARLLRKILGIHPTAVLRSLTAQFTMDCACYLSVISTFLIFVISNGGIAVGDKTAHEICIHIPQLFYFSLFCLVFSWSHFVGEVSNFITFVRIHQKKMIAIFILCAFIVEYNTLVHPYMLADNRHYTFYIWNRFYGRLIIFRFIAIPVYMFAWYVICKTMFDRNDITTLLMYLTTVIGLLVPQKLIDVRYYFVPYIVFRLHVKNTPYTVFNVILEFVTYMVINVITFNLFFTKLIYWPDFAEPQRIIW